MKQHGDFDDEDIGPSKSQRKRDAHELLDLGAALVELAPQQLAEIPLAEEVLAAVKEARSITTHGARKRQLKYLGKLLRQADDAPIREALERLQGRHALTVAHHHQCERWRDRLIAEGDAALTELLDEFPHADRQQLRQLMRAAQTEQAKDKPPQSARALFRALRELIG
ncbi:MAG: ribosome biogenesis factor YjgA [Thiohalomonadaceae bacterium]